jgi:hypothetical protein
MGKRSLSESRVRWLNNLIPARMHHDFPGRLILRYLAHTPVNQLFDKHNSVFGVKSLPDWRARRDRTLTPRFVV